MASKWYQTRKFRIAAIVVVLLLIALLIAPYVLSIDRYRPVIVEKIEEATGRDIEIETLRLHFLPTLHVSVGNLQVKNPRGFPEGDTVAVGSVDIGLAFWPLLKGEVHVGSIEIDSVQANLLTNQRGQTNTDFTPKKKARKAEPEEESGVTVTRIGSVAVRDVTVSSGTFWSGRKQVYPNWTVTGVNLDVRNVDLSDPQWIKKMAADLDLSTIEISVPALKEPMRFTDGEVEVRDNKAEGDFALALGSLRANGTLKVGDLGNPVADFTLGMKELNVADLSALASTKKRPSGPQTRGGGGRNLLARGTVKVGRVLVPPYSAQNVQGQVRLYGNRLVVDPFTLDVYGGKTQGDLLIDLDNPAVPARVNVNAKGVDVAQAMAAASPDAKGTITGSFETRGTLNLPLGGSDPLAGLGGQGTFAVRDGTFPGLNVEGTLAKMAKFMAMEVPTGDTQFSYFGGDYRIADQRVHSRRLDLQSEKLEASLSGSFGFDQTLAYNGSGLLKGSGQQQQQEEEKSGGLLGGLKRVFGKTVQQTMNISQMRVPFTVRGTFQDVKFVVTGPPTPIS